VIIPHNDPRLSWHGHISLEQTSDYTRPWRIPFGERSLFSPSILVPAATQAGVRLVFTSATRRVAGKILRLEENQKLDLCVNGELLATADLAGAEDFVFGDLPAGNKLIELWLPQRGDFALRQIEVDGDDLAPHEDTRPLWVTYGSSITHCRSAASPTKTWPAIVAREKNFHHINLGYGGQCHLDFPLALMMRDLPADYFSICAGINIYGANSLNFRSYDQALIGFVRVIREKHPETPILLISPIYGFHRETEKNAVGWTLPDFRAAMKDAVERLQAAGDKHVACLDGLKLYGESLGHLMPDQLHPNAEGCEALGRNFLKFASPLIFGR